MPRKIYDIKPPKAKEKEKKERAVKHVVHRAPRKKAVVAPSPKLQQSAPKRRRNIFILSAFLLVMLFIYLFFTLPRATVEIWPKLETLSFEQTIIADKSVSSVDEVKAQIPAEYFEVSKSASGDFAATGNADDAGKATGTITVFNKSDPPSPLTLKVGTHFMSDSGKLYVSLEKITIPAAKKSGTKITPGSIKVEVKAVEGGDSYNIAPSNFSVPGLKGSAYYYGIYATSAESMSGGFTGKQKKITSDDIQNAKDSLTDTVSNEAIAELKSKVSDEYVLLDNAIFTTTTNASTQAKAGTIAEQFKYELTIKANALAFKKSDIDAYVREYVLSELPDGKSLLDGSIKTDYTAKTIDVSSGKATIILDFSSSVYESIDRNSLALSLMNKTGDQISQTISTMLGDTVEKTKVRFWPFWVTKSPDNQKGVRVELEFN